MSHDFNYRVNGVALVPQYARAVRLFEGVAGKRADLLEVAYKHGVYVAERHWSQARLARLETLLPDQSAGGTYAGLHGLARRLCGGVVTLQRVDPDVGEVRARALVGDPAEQGSGADRFRVAWPVWLLDGTWEDDAETSVTVSGLGTSGSWQVTPGGSHPVEPIFEVDCVADGASPSVTLGTDLSSLTLDRSFTAGQTIVVDVPARRVTVDGAVDKSSLVVNRGWWMELPPADTSTLLWSAGSGTWDVTTRWRGRHR